MSLQLRNNRNRNLKLAATTGAVVLGATYIVLRTFPHLKTCFRDYIIGSNESSEEDNEPIELNQPEEEDDEVKKKESLLEDSEINEQSLVDVANWSDDNLKSWLGEKEISPPPNASHNSLVSLIKSIQETPK